MEKGRNKIILLAGVIFLSFIFFWTGSQKDNTDSKGQTDNTIPISIGQTHLQALIADTLATRALGLGNRSNIASDQAMLFIFDTSDRYGFWMKDMRFPIDMLWLDEAKKIIFIQSDVSPDSYPEVFTPSVSARYVLETSSGFAEKNGLKIGTQVYF